MIYQKKIHNRPSIIAQFTIFNWEFRRIMARHFMEGHPNWRT